MKPLREQLDRRFTMARSKAMMLEILWSQPEAKRSVYGEKLDSFFFDIVPTIRQLCRIHQAFGPQKMPGFLGACFAWQTTNAETLKAKAQELLMEGLLLAHHYLSDYGQIPDLCFSSQVASTNGKGVIYTYLGESTTSAANLKSGANFLRKENELISHELLGLSESQDERRNEILDDPATWYGDPLCSTPALATYRCNVDQYPCREYKETTDANGDIVRTDAQELVIFFGTNDGLADQRASERSNGAGYFALANSGLIDAWYPVPGWKRK